MAVRRDPLNERGQRIPGSKPHRPRKGSPSFPSLIQLSPIEVYEFLWERALEAASAQITLLEKFSQVKMPGENTEELIRLRRRLENITRENN